MTIKVDVIQAFRVRVSGVEEVQAVRVGLCRACAGWRWQIEWVGGGTGNWSLAHYRTRELARDVAKCAINLGEAVAA